MRAEKKKIVIQSRRRRIRSFPSRENGDGVRILRFALNDNFLVWRPSRKPTGQGRVAQVSSARPYRDERYGGRFPAVPILP